MKNPYDVVAAYYDLEHDAFTADVEMYEQFSAALSRVLIVGVGTGRVAVRLAGLGVEVWGLDSSEAMLDRARKKLGEEPNVHLFTAQMSDFDLKEHFPLIICPLDSFTALESTHDQVAALTLLGRHLDDHGMIILDLVNPHVLPDPDENGRTRRRFEARWGDETVLAYDAVDIDPAEQRMSMHLMYDSFDRTSIHRETAEVGIRWVYRYEMELLLERSGLRLSHLYGDYDLTPYASESPRMIVTAEAAS